MALMTGKEYVESLRKLNMKVYMFGKKVENPVDDPILAPSVNSVKMTYDLAQGPNYADLMTATSHLTGETVNRFMNIHQSTDDLVKKVKMQRLLGQKTAACFQRCVGMDAFNAEYSTTYEIDKKYGTGTWKDNGFYFVDPQYDPDGIFDGWYFYRGELKSDRNGDDKLKKNRIQLQVPAGFNDDNNGAFVTAPSQCDGSKTVKISFEVATNRALVNIKYRIGVTGNGPITEAWLRDRNNILNGNDRKCKSGVQTHTFTVTNGQRIMLKILSTGGAYHVEFADFTYTVE